MKLLFLLVTFLVAVNAVPKLSLNSDEWQAFKTKHGKNFKDAAEETKRFDAYNKHKEMIELHNQRFAAGKESFKQGLNKYSDVPQDEFVKTMNGYKQSAPELSAVAATTSTATTSATTAALSATVDWRIQGYVTAIKDQGTCGSCWTFSTTGSLEGQLFKKTGKLVSLSEQNLLDCSGSYGTHGCNGGRMPLAMQYIAANKGIDTEASYPYKGTQGTCNYNAANAAGTTTGPVSVAPTEAALQTAVASIGPISVAIDASLASFQHYTSGIYNDVACNASSVNHAVLVVGYGTDSTNGDYWIVKNSWGTTWGESGYVRMARNQNNRCGIASAAVYPQV